MLDQTPAPGVQPTAATPAEIISQAVASFSADVTALQIEEIRVAAEALNIAGEADKVGYNQVDEARKEVKRRRLAVTNREKQLLELPKNFTKAVKDEAKKYVDLLKPIEDGLTFKQKAIDDVKAERERQEKIKLEKRQSEFYALGMLRDHELTFIHPENVNVRITLQELKSFTNEQIDEVKAKINEIAEAKKKAEIERQRAEKAARDAEAAERAKAAEAARQQIAKSYQNGMQDAQAEAEAQNASTSAPQPSAESFLIKQPQPGFSQTFQPQPANTAQPSQFPPGVQAPPVHIPNARQAAQSQQPAPTQNGYEIGFNEAKRRILEILSNPAPTTRKVLFETIQNLKP